MIVSKRSLILGASAFVGLLARSTDARAAPVVTPQMFGARADNIADDRAAIQSAIDHVGGHGGGTVFFPAGTYKVVATERQSSPAVGHVVDGTHLVINVSNVALVGADRDRTRLNFRAFGDRSHQEHWQSVDNKVWRGPGLFIRGAGSASQAVDQIRIANLVLDGGADFTSDFKWPADLKDGLGWDLTHKGIFIEEDRHVGRVTIENCEICRWRGELIYQGGPFGGRLEVFQCELHDSSADGLSSSMQNVVKDTKIYNIAFAGIECAYFDRPSIYHNIHIFDVGEQGISLDYFHNAAQAGRQTLSDIKLERCPTGLLGLGLNNCVIKDLEMVDCGWPAGHRALQLYDNGVYPCADVDVRNVKFVIAGKSLSALLGLVKRSAVPWSNVRFAGLVVSREEDAKRHGRVVDRLVERACGACMTLPIPVDWEYIEKGAVRCIG